MRNSVERLAVVLWLGAAGLAAQEAPLPGGSVNINLTRESPVTLVSMSSDQSRATARGAAMVLDLHMSLVLRNTGASRIHGITLRVVSQEVTLGGKGSVTYPSLNVGPGEVFPARIDMQLVRPTQVAAGPLVQVDLDGVLYQDLSFYGPDRLHSRRYLTACELEARRDREYFKGLLARTGKDGLRQAMLGSLARQAELAVLNVRVARGPAVASAALPAEHTAQFALVQFPDAPLELVAGSAMVGGNQVRTPRIEVRNTSGKAVKYAELGWVLTDQSGRQSAAASLPFSDPVSPGQTATVLQDATLKLFSTSGGQPVNIQRMTGFVSHVEFADGNVWVPAGKNLESPELRKALPPSAEEQRLSDLYNRKGIDALIEELKRF